MNRANTGSKLKIRATLVVETPFFWANVCERNANADARTAVTNRVIQTIDGSFVGNHNESLMIATIVARIEMTNICIATRVIVLILRAKGVSKI